MGRRKAGLVIAARIVAIIMTAAGVNALLFAGLFANLTALSAGFAERKTAALLIGCAALVVGVAVIVAEARTRRAPSGRRSSPERALLGLAAGIVIGWIGFGAAVY